MNKNKNPQHKKYLILGFALQSAIVEILENYINNKTDKVELYSGFSKHLYEPYPISVERIQPEKYVGQLTTASPLEEDELGDLRWSSLHLTPYL